jgi:Family of unknown function (DUF6345)
VTINIVWCSFFKRPGLAAALRLSYQTLKHAYRGPSLFAGKMQEAGHSTNLIKCDEKVALNDFQTDRIHEQATIFYLMTHGTFGSAGYGACLKDADWHPQVSGLGSKDTVVAVFDTCYLIDSKYSWQSIWSCANFGPSLRLMLGFDNLAEVGRGPALRGYAFAENLVNGQTFVDAWFAAVATNTVVSNKAIAIGIGDSQSDAQQVLNTASLAAMPSARSTSATAHLELRP